MGLVRGALHAEGAGLGVVAMSAVIVLMDVTVFLWATLGALVVQSYVQRTLNSDRFLRYYLVSTGVLIVLAALLRYVRMEE